MGNPCEHKYNSFWFDGLGFVLLLTLFLASCSTSKHIPEDQTILKKNQIEFVDDQYIDDKYTLNFELNTFIRQQPNSNFFLVFPREYYYLTNSEPGDTSRWNNWMRNDMGEEPTYYNATVAAETAKAMQQYLRNNKGYYHAEVSFKEKGDNKYSKVKYLVDTKKRYSLNSVDFISHDKNVMAEMQRIKDQTLLSPGTSIDINTFGQEKKRIADHFQNIGYAEIEVNRFRIYGDTSEQKFALDIVLEVIPKLDGKDYTKYTIGEINVYTDYHQGQENLNISEIDYEGIKFRHESKNVIVKPHRIKKFITLKSGGAYRESDRTETFQRLSRLDMYKFSSVTPVLNAEVDSVLDYNIFLTPHRNKYLTDYGVEAFYATINNSRQRFGSSAHASLENRNVLGGAENNKLDVEVGLEVGTLVDLMGVSSFGIASSQARIQDVLEIPRHIDIFRTTKLMHKVGFFSDKLYEDILQRSTTRIGLGLDYQNITDYYGIVTLTTSKGYDYEIDNRHFFGVRQFALNLNRYNLDSTFVVQISGNQLILRSLVDNLFTGFLFRDISYAYAGPKDIHGNSFAFSANLELSGWETALLNTVSNDFFTLKNFEISKYFRFEVDTRYYKDLTSSTQLATRLNLGIAEPFSNSLDVPFIKQFYAGGPNSMRAWQIRELGPGGYEDSSQVNNNQLFFQQGDIKLEGNIEYRFDLFYVFEMALFLDAGNVWTLQEDINRPGAQFGSAFYKQIAIGGGYGLRLDFVYFNIRFDFGYKIRNNRADADGNYWFPSESYKNFGNVNIAVNYPF